MNRPTRQELSTDFHVSWLKQCSLMQGTAVLGSHSRKPKLLFRGQVIPSENRWKHKRQNSQSMVTSEQTFQHDITNEPSSQPYGQNVHFQKSNMTADRHI